MSTAVAPKIDLDFFLLVQPNFKLALLSCPFATQDATGEDILAGSLGDAMDVICLVSIQIKDACGEVISICSCRSKAEKYKLALSTSNPLDEEGLLPTQSICPNLPAPTESESISLTQRDNHALSPSQKSFHSLLDIPSQPPPQSLHPTLQA
jgi:hypothetical protein